MELPPWQVIDLLMAGIAALIASAFFTLYRRLGEPAIALVTAGFLLLSGGIALTQSALVGETGAFDAIRLVFQTGGMLVILAGYLGMGDTPRARAFVNVGWGTAAASAVVAMLAIVSGDRISRQAVEPFHLTIHVLQFLGWLSIAALSARGWFAAPSALRALVPVAFLAYAMSRWTWIAFDLSRAADVIPLVYISRGTALALLAMALIWQVSWFPSFVTLRHSDDDT